MRNIISRLAVPAVAMALGGGILVGCGAPTSAAAAAPAPAPGVAEEPVATNTVAIQNFAFSPATVTIKAGTTVTWTNQDQDPHTVSAMSGAFHSPTLNTGQSYRYTFTTPGHFEYLCTIHPFMTAAVVVTP
jgi:plastocyanin